MTGLEGRRILVVEDDECLRETLVDVLAYAGAEVSSAENGAVAFEMFRNNKYDLIISDVKMPGGDGVELMRNIERCEGAKPVRVICSGYLDESNRSVMDLGVSLIVEKPFTTSVLLQELNRLLNPEPLRKSA